MNDRLSARQHAGGPTGSAARPALHTRPWPTDRAARDGSGRTATAPAQFVWKVSHQRKQAFWEDKPGEKKPLYPPLGYQEVYRGSGASDDEWREHQPGPAPDGFHIALGYRKLRRIRGRSRGSSGQPVHVRWSHTPFTYGKGKVAPEPDTLSAFSAATESSEYTKWGKFNPDMFGMNEIPRAMNAADSIHFNLDGMPRDRHGNQALTNLLASGRHWTVKELNWLLQDPARLGKAHFYRNGKRLSADETRAFMGHRNLDARIPLSDDHALEALRDAARHAGSGDHASAANAHRRAERLLPRRHWTASHEAYSNAIPDLNESYELFRAGKPVGAANVYRSAVSDLAAKGLKL